MSRKAIASLLIPLLFLTGTALGDSEIIARVDVGFAGAYKAGLWAPVRVHFAPNADLDGAEVSLVVPDGDGVPSRVSAPLPSPAPDSVLLYVRFGRVHCPLTVRVKRAGDVLAERDFEPSETTTEDTIPHALQSDQKLVVVVGTASLGIADAVTQMREPTDEETQVVRLEDASSLPDRWYGYEGVGLVVLSGSDVACYAGLAAEDERVDALSKWVRRGGRLMIAIGEHGEQLLGPDGALRGLVPGTYSKQVSLNKASSLERFSGSEESIPALVDNKKLQVAQLMDVQGMVAAREGDDVPLVMVRVWGFGQVTFLASDLDRGPLGQWNSRPTFVATLLGWPTKPIEDEQKNKAILHFGYSDLAGQLRSGLDQFEGVWRIPFGVIIAAIVFYLLLIGPGDYFLLRKFLGRMEWTWVTFPATVILFCVVAYVVAHRTKGDQFLANQATLIDVDVETGELRGTAWANVFSPATRRMDVHFSIPGQENELAGGELLTAWLGLPGKALGGMDPKAPPPVVWPEPYDFKDDRAWMAHMPLQVWSSKSLTARWSGKMPSAFECKLEQNGAIPSGHLTSNLDMELTDCLLVYGDWVYELGTLRPGQRFRVGASIPRRELASFLTGRKLVFDKEEERAMERTTRYSVESTDAEYILRAMTFFQAAGGRPYTHLANSYQGFVDMSGLLQPNRAVLVGKPAGSDTEADEERAFPWRAQISLSSGGEAISMRETHSTLVRFVLPVKADK